VWLKGLPVNHIQTSFSKLSSFFKSALAVLIASSSLMVVGALASSPAGAVVDTCTITSVGFCTDLGSGLNIFYTLGWVVGNVVPQSTVVIPSSVTVNGTSYPITRILSVTPNDTSNYSHTVTSITIPPSITLVDANAFYSNFNLTLYFQVGWSVAWANGTPHPQSTPGALLSVAQNNQLTQTGVWTFSGCPGGFYNASGTCTPAGLGTYSPGGLVTSATECQPGFYSVYTAQTSCTISPVGFYVPDYGRAIPLIAPAGSYVSTTGATQATPCPPGTTTTQAGQSACTQVMVYSKPTAPSAVSAVMTNGSATVSFSPGSSGNLPTYNQIDMYINGVLVGNVCNVSGASSCPISNLGPDVSFSFTVTAINSKGSAASALSNSVSYASPSFAMPTTTTTTTTVPPVMKTITCLKGAITKKVTALNPVCPAGYKKK